MYKIFDYDNKITKKDYVVLYEIAKKNYSKIGIGNDSKELFKNWVNIVTNTKGYNILVYYINNSIVGYIAFMYIDIGLMLCEVQIKEEFQGKNEILKSMLKKLCSIVEKRKFNYIYGNINKKNTKSLNVFNHIGFENEKGNLYKISYEKLIKWINK